MERDSISIDWQNKHLHFITGRLAEYSLRERLVSLSERVGFEYTVEVLGITVAALMTPAWIAKRTHVAPSTDLVIVPGYCDGPLECVEEIVGCNVVRGPRDLRRLDVFFRQDPVEPNSYGKNDIQIIAEINHAPKLTRSMIVDEAKRLRNSGADVIDIGCNPGAPWSGVGDAVKSVKDLGVDVSIDSMDPGEVQQAVHAGANLVLSVDSSNRCHAVDWGVEVVAIPDAPEDIASLENTVEYLASRNVPLRIDPVLSPIGFGFAKSLGRYLQMRAKYLDAEMMMGVGNLSELTDVDSAGINVLLLGFCQEIGIRSILTTEVIPWAKTSVRECDIARRLVYHAVQNGVLPKHVDSSLVMLRDVDVPEYAPAFFNKLSDNIRDHNLRVFVDRDGIHLVTNNKHLVGKDPFAIFQEYIDCDSSRMDVSHAFYMGYELCKAITAYSLGKNYQQDEALDWGFLTMPEDVHSRLKDRKNGP